MTSSPTIAPPKRLDAETLLPSELNGRNRALLIGGRGEDGRFTECVVKLRARMENQALHPVPSLLEWVGSALAAELGIASPRPYEVIITRLFAKSIPDRRISDEATRSVGSVYGSGFVRGTQVGTDFLDATMRTAAAAVVAFDVFIHNVDRRRKNTNLLLAHDQRKFVAFDHGEAFAFIWGSFGVDPATDPMRSMLADHVLGPCVQRKGAPDLTEFRARLAALGDERLEGIAAATPGDWQTGVAAGKLQLILDILRQRRDAVGTWLPQVEAWMEQ